MVNPVKWPKANLQSELFNWVKWNLVASFAVTIIIPLLYLLNILIILKTPNTVVFNLNLVILGSGLAAFGLFFWIISFINLGKSFGVLPQKQKKVKTGLYKYFNHPMYIGIWACFLGLSLANSSWAGLVFLNLVITPLLFIRAAFEEKKLTN
jgi:protein-S-isoprenylcysteine O-methyltransferase Ste14